jgi:putative two-component system response regulator
MDSNGTNEFLLNVSETTKIDMEKIRSIADCCTDDSVRELLLTLYKTEKNKARQLEAQMKSIDNRTEKYADDLSKAYSRVRENETELAAANDQLRKYAVDLRTTISNLRTVNTELEEAYYDTIRRLVIAAEYKDHDTGNHITRISRYCALMAEKIGLEQEEIHTIKYASPMHDIGKIGIPDRILLKNGKLLAPELEMMRLHTIIGSNILADSKAKVLQCAQQIAMYHHEKWNGQGYPNGIKGDDIPFPARIVTLADTFDALVSKRPYKEAFSVETACEIIKNEREQHFDPEVVDSFFENLEEILNIRNEISDPPSSVRKNSAILN